tara:strand:+ start:621 stop:1019 length:399 start_codon:yes stop_codon:yes gene_type:complete
MTYFINHVHIRSNEPEKSAEWYSKFFEAKIVSSKEVMPGTITIGMQAGDGSCRLMISSQPVDGSDTPALPEINQLGLEHFGFQTNDINGDIEKFENAGVRIIMPVTDIPGGAKIAYIEAPDNVVIELVNPPA